MVFATFAASSESGNLGLRIERGGKVPLFTRTEDRERIEDWRGRAMTKHARVEVRHQ